MHHIRVQPAQADPEPFTIGALVVAALGAAAGLGNFYIQVTRSRKEREEAKRRTRDALRRAFSAFKRTKAAFEKFISYLDKFSFRTIKFGVGSPHLVGSESLVHDFEEIRENLLDSIRRLSDLSAELALLLDEEDATKFREGAERFDSLIKEAFQSKDFGSFIYTMSTLLREVDDHLRRLAGYYEVEY